MKKRESEKLNVFELAGSVFVPLLTTTMGAKDKVTVKTEFED